MITLSIFQAIFIGCTTYILFFIVYYHKIRLKYQIGFLMVHIFSVLLVSITILPIYYNEELINKNYQGLGIHLKPFKEMIRLYNSSKEIFIKNIGGNFVLLMPLTIIIIIFKERVKFYQIFLFLLITSFSIEMIQLLKNYLYGYRVNLVDIDDLFLNVAGGSIVYLFYILCGKIGIASKFK